MEFKNGIYYSGNFDEDQKQLLRERLTDSLLEDRIFVCYHNIKDNSRIVRLLNDHNEEDTRQVLLKHDDPVDAFKEIVTAYTHPEDRKPLLDLLDPAHYVPVLRNKKSESLYYRWKYDNRYYLYNRITVRKLDGIDEEPTEVIIICTDVDSQIREKLMIEEMHKRYVSGVYALSREYSSVYYVNLDTKEVAPFDLSNRIQGMFGDKFYHMDYDKAVEEYIDHAVIDEDKERMTEILSRDYVRRCLVNQDHFTRIYLNNDNCYCEMKCVKVAQEDASNVVIMGFAVKDDEIRSQQEHKKQKDFQLSLLDGLTRDFYTVILIKPGNVAELYRASDNVRVTEFLRYAESQDEGYDEGVRYYVERFVADEDKERMIEEMKFENLLNNVPEEGIYPITFKRVNENGEVVYLRICCTKAVSGNGEVNIVAAFRNVDTLVRNEMRQQQLYEKAINERDMDGLTGLQNRYCFENKIKTYGDGDYDTIGCIYIDVDGLHEINNEEGHDRGDFMIKTVAGKVSELWGKNDTFRIGGDEFIAFVFDTPREKIAEDVQELKKVLAEHGFSASVGYNVEYRNFLDANSFIKHAEDMMFAEKKEHYKGKNDRRRG
ncbi:MAG: GGDEF domain-containing protein [Lachnospiraceae bacterium]|nr:GGDEF domain-containing protein [Lachnospiraceae bacterium]